MITVIDETNNDDSAASKQSPPDDKSNENSSAIKVAPFPLPPPSMVMPPNSNSDLMSRLKNFLPQMESANQELLSMPVMGKDPVRLDTNLQLEDEDCDSDDDEGSQTSNPLIQEVDKTEAKETKSEIGSSAKETPNEANPAAPTIQLEFTLGNMASNPLMKLLANEGNDDDDDSNSDNDDDNANDQRKNAISNLLTESQNSSETKNNIVLLDGSNKNTNKKSLITELS